MSIRYKIAFLFALLVTIILTIVSVSVYFFSLKDRQHTFDTRLKKKDFSIAKMYDGISNNNYAVLRKIDATAVSSLYNKSILVITYDNMHAYTHSDVPGDSLNLSAELIERTKN